MTCNQIVKFLYPNVSRHLPKCLCVRLAVPCFNRVCLLLKNPALRLRRIWDVGQVRPIELSHSDDAGKRVPKCPCFKTLAVLMSRFKIANRGLLTAPPALIKGLRSFSERAQSPQHVLINWTPVHIQLPTSTSGRLQWVLCTWS